MKRILKRICLLIVLGMLASVGFTLTDDGVIPSVQALAPGVDQSVIYNVHGRVYRRVHILDKATNKPTFAKYNDQGVVQELVSVATGTYENAFILSAPAFESIKASMSSEAKNGRRLISRSEYESMSFVTPSGDAVQIVKLKVSSNSVVIKDSKELSASWVSPIVAEYQISKMAATTSLSSGTESLIISEKGDILGQYDSPIGYLTSYKVLPDGDVPLSEYGDVMLSEDEEALGPMEGVKVSAPFWGGNAVTDQRGRYSMSLILPPALVLLIPGTIG
ncbi:MAG: hypothetical protein CO186_02635 [Zetaproteobacteria bacterium CG_4_9_14_3_um_filter_49_83]|nr:MAG: hypothetical protein AUJ56_03985 [Zetaproteobacteria bacterium CG1_02_49_23]PIQ30463.1 MAG: hypothetical protein COW62_12225 [Zetaproteobacteria bacterium CG17_big_fil_post_rev_8_21_14_2_50_50_13]PJA36056.1 MAG: hypothetical protein CO186_02635 [Zetaproteobacteria bacterium CG_4_9_14_3_um_filter_49_83]